MWILLPNEKALAHISWLKNEQGILMSAICCRNLMRTTSRFPRKLNLNCRKNGKFRASEKPIAENTFSVGEHRKSGFFNRKKLARSENVDENDALDFAISGEWNFSDAEAAKMANDIFAEYRKLFGEIPNKKIQIALAHFPKEIKFGRWEADTRGATSMIFSSDMPFKTLSLQRLHEQLRHELFHLWIPNNLALTGNYDWFYEGFTVYKALKTGVADKSNSF